MVSAKAVGTRQKCVCSFVTIRRLVIIVAAVMGIVIGVSILVVLQFSLLLGPQVRLSSGINLCFLQYNSMFIFLRMYDTRDPFVHSLSHPFIFPHPERLDHASVRQCRVHSPIVRIYQNSIVAPASRTNSKFFSQNIKATDAGVLCFMVLAPLLGARISA